MAEKVFIPLHIAVLTISDTRTFEDDLSGKCLVSLAQQAGHKIMAHEIVQDSILSIQAKVQQWIENEDVQVVISTGGTGITGRDVTPEAFRALYEKEIPGFGELFRWISYKKIATSTIQSRATAGIANGTLLFALPGSTNACKDAWNEILVFQLDSRQAPCNFADLLPRLRVY